MKLKLDENLGHRAAEQCRQAGHDVDTVVDDGLASADDDKVHRAAATEGSVLVTLDLDFSNPGGNPCHAP